MEVRVQSAVRFAGYPSPDRLVADPTLSRDDKIGGLRTWRRLVLRLGAGPEGDLRARLVEEIDRALALLEEKRSR
jgi:hypothetical protein